MKHAIIVWVIVWALLVATVSCTRADESNPHQIMEDMLDSYTYMSYSEHVEPFDFHRWSGYETQWNLSCVKLDMLTKIDLTPEKCKNLFLLYWGL